LDSPQKVAKTPAPGFEKLQGSVGFRQGKNFHARMAKQPNDSKSF
jgi:hypothetical protein